MTSDGNIPQKIVEWVQGDQNTRKGGSLNRVIPSARNRTINRSMITAIFIPQNFPRKHFPLYNITPQFAFITSPRMCPITQFVLLDIYSGYEIHLCPENRSQIDCPLDRNTICISNFKLIDPEAPCWLTVVLLRRDRDHYLCLIEFDLSSAKLTIHDMVLLLNGRPLSNTKMLFDSQSKLLYNKLSVFLVLCFGYSDMDIGKEIELVFTSNNPIPTMSIRDGPDFTSWNLYSPEFINRKVYGFAGNPNAQNKPNFEELIVAKMETFSPYNLGCQEKLKLHGLDFKYKTKLPYTDCWHDVRFYALFKNDNEYNIFCMNLDTLTWNCIINFIWDSSYYPNIHSLFTDRKELTLVFHERRANFPSSAGIYENVLFPIGRPFLLIKLATFAVQYFSYKNLKYAKVLETDQWLSSLKLFPNSTKCKTCPK